MVGCGLRRGIGCPSLTETVPLTWAERPICLEGSIPSPPATFEYYGYLVMEGDDVLAIAKELVTGVAQVRSI